MLERHKWKITGISPLLQNNPAETLGKEQPDGAPPKVMKYDDKKEAEKRTYKTDDGLFYHPSAAVRASLLVAAVNRKISGRAAKGIVGGSVFPVGTEMIIRDGTGKPMKKYKRFKGPVGIGKSRVMRVWPMWEDWTMTIEIDIDTDFITPAVVTDLLNVAGRICGWGDFRPDTSKQKNGVGTFGRFTAEAIE